MSQATRPLMPASAVGRRIRQERLERSLTQTELARQIGIQQSDLSRMEKGEYRVPLDVLFRILQAFQISFAEFFEDGRRRQGLTQRESSLLHSYRMLSDDAQAEVEAFVEFKIARETGGSDR